MVSDSAFVLIGMLQFITSLGTYSSPFSQSTSQHFQASKFIYVKQNFIHSQIQQSSNGATKILINPNFKVGTVHINPNFNKPAIVQSKPNIHVNPNILKSEPKILQENRRCYINPNVLMATTASQTNTVQATLNSSTKEAPKVITPIKRTIVSTPTKIVKAPNIPSLNKVNIIEQEVKIAKRRKSIRSKYKIVKSQENLTLDSNKLIKPSRSVQQINKYKVDKRPLDIQQKQMAKIYNKIHLNKSINLMEQRWKLPKCSYLNISGVLYKKSPNSLKRSTSFEEDKKAKTKTDNSPKIVHNKNKKLVTIGGVKYKLNMNHKTLKLLTVQKNLNRKANASSSLKSVQSSNIRKIVLKNKRTLLVR